MNLNYGNILNKSEKKGGVKFNFRPIFFCAFAVVFGVVCSLRIEKFTLYFALFSLLSVLISLLSVKKYRILALTMLILAFLLGFFCAENSKNYREYTEISHISGTVCEVSSFKNTTYITLDDVSVNGEISDGKFSVKIPFSSKEITLYAKVIFNGLPQKSSENKFLDGINYEVEYESGFTVISKSSNVFGKINLRLRETLEKGMSGENPNIWYAVLTGDTTLIDSELLSNIRSGGVAHLFAVSGLHIGSLYAFCMLILPKKRKTVKYNLLRFIFVSFIVLFYDAICGFTPSVVRATTLCLCIGIFGVFGRRVDRLESVGLAVIIIMLLNPVEIFSVGFALSFSACFGIFILSKTLRNFLNGAIGSVLNKDGIDTKRRIIDKISSFLSICISVQSFISPFMIYHFGTLSFAGLLLNCIFIPVISVLYPVMLVLTFISSVFYEFSSVILYVPDAVTHVLTIVFYVVDFSPLSIEYVKPHAIKIIAYCLYLCVLSDKYNADFKEKTYVLSLLELLMIVKM